MEGLRGRTWPELVTLLGSKPPDEPAWYELSRRIRAFAHELGSAGRSPRLDFTELAQSVLLKLLEPGVLKRVSAAETPEAYLRKMVRNELINRLRRQSIERKALGHLARIPRTSRPDEDSRLERLLCEWERLSKDEQQLLVLRFWQDCSPGEIASRLGVPYSTAAVRLFRLLHRLRKRLGDDSPS